tara:strand:- start:1344 stop:1556 length:213 start_codon:yes stop_codon:yes gene_type:complete
MEELITMIGELQQEKLQRFLMECKATNLEDFITFLYNLNEDKIQETIKILEQIESENNVLLYSELNNLKK